MAGIDSFRKRLEAREEVVTEEEADEVRACFGTVRTGRSPFALNFIQLDGSQVFTEYSYVTGGALNVDGEAPKIVISTVDKEFQITGRNLEPLFRLIFHHRVSFIRAVRNDVDEADIWVGEIKVEGK